MEKNDFNKEDLENNVKELMSLSDSNALIHDSFNSIRLNRKNMVSTFIIMGIALVLSFIGCFKADTVQWISSAVEIILEIQLAIFGSIIAVYSILIAFFDKKFIVKLATIKSKENKKTKLIEYIKYFENVLCLSFIGIIISAVLFLFFKLVPDNWMISSYKTINEVIACIFSYMYLYFNLRVIYELKSLIFNTIVLMRTSIVYRAIDIFNSSKEDDNES